MTHPAPTHPERVLGCLLGGAVGDAFGYAIEFDDIAAIRARYGPLGMVEPLRQIGRLVVSDDTQLTLFTQEGLNRARAAGCLMDQAATLEHVRLATLDWYHTQSDNPVWARYTGTLGRAAVLQARRAPGSTCLAGCAKGARGTIEAPINASKGCGGVMRVAPVGLVREYTVAQAFELAARAAAQTHGHPEGYLPAGAFAAIVRGLIEGQALLAAVAAALEVLSGWAHAEGTRKALQAALRAVDGIRGRRVGPEDVARLGEGWVGEEALAIGVYAAAAGDTYAHVIQIAANHSGDSDSTASIAGQLFGAAHGAGQIPAEWEAGLDCAAELSEVARQAG